MVIRIAATVLLLLVLAGCGSSAEFVPDAGPYFGTFVSEQSQVGTFSLTTQNNLLGGGGTVVHNGQQITVSITAQRQGRTFTGNVINANQGNGNFSGVFSENGSISGQFNFTDTLGQHITNGTFTAELQ